MSEPNIQKKTMAVAELFTMILSHMEDKDLLLKAPLVSQQWKDTIDETPELLWKLFKATRRMEVPIMPMMDDFPDPDWNPLTHEAHGFITDEWVRLVIYHAMKRIDLSLRYFYVDLTKWYNEMPQEDRNTFLPCSHLPRYLSTASWLSMFISQPPPKVAKLFLAPRNSRSEVSFDFTIRNPDGITWEDVVEHLKDEIAQWYSGQSVQLRHNELDETEKDQIFHQLCLLFEATMARVNFFGVFILSRNGLTPKQKSICHELTGVSPLDTLFEFNSDEEAEFSE
jgi:hypothetical protein